MRVVLVSPRNPGNVASIGRTCVGFGARLDIVGPVGFDMRDPRRDKLDYWELLEGKWDFHRSWGDYVLHAGGIETLASDSYFFSAHAKANVLGDVVFDPPGACRLVLGSETSGFRGLIPESDLEAFAERFVKIPMVHPDMRCYNLAISAGMALYEAFRQQHQ